MPHFNYKNILLQAFFKSNFDCFSEEWFVFDQIINKRKLRFEMVENGCSFWAVICQRNKTSKVIIELLCTHIFTELIALHVVFVDHLLFRIRITL